MRIISTQQSTQSVDYASKIVDVVGNRSKLNIKKKNVIIEYVITFKQKYMYEKKARYYISTVVKKILGF